MLIHAASISLLAACLSVTGQVLWKKSVTGLGFHLLLDPRFLLGLFVYGLSTLVYIYAVSRFPLSYVYPFMGMTFVLMLLPAKYFLSEQIDVWRIAGALVIMAGIAISSIGRH